MCFKPGTLLSLVTGKPQWSPVEDKFRDLKTPQPVPSVSDEENTHPGLNGHYFYFV